MAVEAFAPLQEINAFPDDMELDEQLRQWGTAYHEYLLSLETRAPAANSTRPTRIGAPLELDELVPDLSLAIRRRL